MGEEVVAAQAIAGLAMSAALMEGLLKRGLIEEADVGTILRDAASYAAAFCVEAAPEVERESLRLLALVTKAEQKVAATELPASPMGNPVSK